MPGTLKIRVRPKTSHRHPAVPGAAAGLAAFLAPPPTKAAAAAAASSASAAAAAASTARTGDSAGEFEIVPVPNPVTFDEGFFLTVRAIQILRQRNRRMIVVGMAGPSGAGKTSLADRVLSVLPATTVISLDNYLDSTRRVIDGNFDDARLIDFDLLVQNIVELKAGKTTKTPLYDFRKSGRYAYADTVPPRSMVLIVEGTYALHHRVRHLLDLTVAVSGGVHNDLIKRILRDVHRTGQEPYQAMKQITETVYPMYKVHIEPDLKNADIRILNSFNPFSALINPVFILKSDKAISVDQVRQVLPGAVEADDSSQDVYFRHRETSPMGGRDWIRVRNCSGQYSVMFSDDRKDGDWIVTPRLDFQVTSEVLGGLMTLGYVIGAVLTRRSRIFRTEDVTVQIERLEQLGGDQFVMVKGKNRSSVARVAHDLGLDGTYTNKSFIEIYQERMGVAAARL